MQGTRLGLTLAQGSALFNSPIDSTHGRAMTNQASADMLCSRAKVELVFLLAHQRHPKTRQRRDWTLLRSLVREALASGARPEHLQDGPWHIGQRPLRKPGRNGLRFVPLVTRGGTEIMMPTPKEAEELVAFLNWCSMPDFGER